MSAALLLTVAMAGSHDCCCPTYSTSYYAAPYGYGYGYGYSASYGYPSYSSYYGSPSYSSSYPSYNGGYARSSSSGYARPSNGGYARSSGHQEHSAGYAPQTSSQSNVVQMTDRGFEPALIKVNVGDAVEWRNVSSKTHTATANPEFVKDPAHVVLPKGAEPFHSEDVAPGGKFSHTFTVPGTYYYVCQPHEDMGMVGIIVVTDPEKAQPPMPNSPTPARSQNGGRTY
jgi:plastocyanin